MHVTMVIICSKTLEKKKAVDDVTPRESNSELQRPRTMSKGTTLFSCGTVEADRWRDRGRSCAESLWDVLPEACQRGGVWGVTGLIRELSLSEGVAGPSPSPSAAPPTKRQCRSLSFSDELGDGRGSSWRPAGSRVWASVEKRRCHSGGSYPVVQRSSSFSLPARSNALPLALGLPRLSADPADPTRPLSLSHERIGPSGPRAPSPASSPDSTPELGRRACPGGLARSRSQPCALNDRKAGLKRRRPEDAPELRPSLDLAKMTQKLRTFQSLSCPGITGVGSCQSNHAPPPYSSNGQCEADCTSPCDLGAGPRPGSEEGEYGGEGLSNEELDSGDFEAGPANGEEEGGAPWAGSCEGGGKDAACQLGGELDIEQIERN